MQYLARWPSRSTEFAASCRPLRAHQQERAGEYAPDRGPLPRSRAGSPTLADFEPAAPWFRRLPADFRLIPGILLLTFSVLQPLIVPLIWGASPGVRRLAIAFVDLAGGSVVAARCLLTAILIVTVIIGAAVG